MEYLQYVRSKVENTVTTLQGFKPCYKWNTFNTNNIKY